MAPTSGGFVPRFVLRAQIRARDFNRFSLTQFRLPIIESQGNGKVCAVQSLLADPFIRLAAHRRREGMMNWTKDDTKAAIEIVVGLAFGAALIYSYVSFYGLSL